MTRRNDKRNNRRNRQRNNNSEVSPFAQMILGAILSNGAGMIANALMDKAGENENEQPKDIPHEGTRKVGNHVESSVIVKNDGTATEIPIPDGYEVFISEEGKPMIRKKTWMGLIEKAPDAGDGSPITYDDISKKLFLKKDTFFVVGKDIASSKADDENYNDFDNCTSVAQAKRMAAFNKLQNIAKYLNGDWKPKFDGNTELWDINVAYDSEEYIPCSSVVYNNGMVYFKSEQLANEAIRLMGEDSLNDLFSIDW